MGFNLSEWLEGRRYDKALRQAQTAAAHRVVVNPHHAVAIRPGKECCGEARALAGRRFLSGEAPGIPLRECTAKQCTCVYQHFDDRRSGTERRNAQTFPRNERRRSRGRRVDDP